ncbi:MAG TPA: glycosyltransferase family 4 protein [Phycisphaerales bacterium]|nr:glycosyltransferase family 4 protein [Phycisphaerales bacterium]
MRILHISTRLILGGSQENTILSCEGQARLGHKVHLAYGPIYGPEGSMLERVQSFNQRCESGEERVRPVGRYLPARDEGKKIVPIVLHEVPALVREVRPFTDYRCLRQLKQLIGRIGPDVVHTHSSKAGILGRFAAWSFQRSPSKRVSTIESPPPGVVHTIHGPPFMPGEEPRTRLNNLLYTLAERAAARKSHIIISVAEAMTRLFLSRNIGQPSQYVTVYSGMETGPFLHPAPGQDRASQRAALHFTPDDIIIGTVSRLAEHKGHDDLLDGLAPMLAQNPRLKLLWVGDGWWRNRLLQKAREKSITIRELDKPNDAPTHTSPAQLTLTGLVDPDRVPGLIHAMDILAHPSYREGLPRTVPQALLSGIPAVAYDVDGTGEVCIDHVTGRLIPPGNATQLADAINQLAQDAHLRATLGAAGRDMCTDRFDADRMVAELEAIYRRAITLARPTN